MGLDWIGKRVKLIFQDSEKVLIKIGIIQQASAEFVNIKTDIGIEIIPTSRVLRMEVLNDD